MHLQSVIENMKGLSRDTLYGKLRTVSALSYQCSESSTADEIKSVFETAIGRQKTSRDNGYRDMMVVFLDEAGLPTERHEALKIIHEYLDKQEVRSSTITFSCFTCARRCLPGILCAGLMHHACQLEPRRS